MATLKIKWKRIKNGIGLILHPFVEYLFKFPVSLIASIFPLTIGQGKNISYTSKLHSDPERTTHSLNIGQVIWFLWPRFRTEMYFHYDLQAEPHKSPKSVYMTLNTYSDWDIALTHSRVTFNIDSKRIFIGARDGMNVWNENKGNTTCHIFKIPTAEFRRLSEAKHFSITHDFRRIPLRRHVRAEISQFAKDIPDGRIKANKRIQSTPLRGVTDA